MLLICILPAEKTKAYLPGRLKRWEERGTTHFVWGFVWVKSLPVGCPLGFGAAQPHPIRHGPPSPLFATKSPRPLSLSRLYAAGTLSVFIHFVTLSLRPRGPGILIQTPISPLVPGAAPNHPSDLLYDNLGPLAEGAEQRLKSCPLNTLAFLETFASPPLMS